jgi:hypothetical protein
MRFPVSYFLYQVAMRKVPTDERTRQCKFESGEQKSRLTSREESRLEETENGTEDGELLVGGDEGHSSHLGRGNSTIRDPVSISRQSEGTHDCSPGDSDTREEVLATDLAEEDVGGQLEDDVRDEEDEGDNGVAISDGECEVGGHTGLTGDRDVGPGGAQRVRMLVRGGDRPTGRGKRKNNSPVNEGDRVERSEDRKETKVNLAAEEREEVSV